MIKEFLRFMMNWIFRIVSGIVTMLLWGVAFVMYGENNPAGAITLFLIGLAIMAFTRRRR